MEFHRRQFLQSTSLLYGSWGKLRTPAAPEQRPYLAVVDEAYHLSVHRIEGRQRFHVALSDTGRVVDVCATAKRSHARGG